MSVTSYNPVAAQNVSNPFPALAHLRENDPAHFSDSVNAWFITRYEDTKALLQDPALSSDRLKPFYAAMPAEQRNDIADIVRYLTQWMVFTDPPDHTRLRTISSQAFSVERMNGMRARIQYRVDALLDELHGKSQLDFIADFAGPLPALIIMDMLGVPAERLDQIKQLSDHIALFIGSARASGEKYALAQQATQQMAAYFRELITDRRSKPQDDLVSDLIKARHPKTGAQLNEDELVGTCILLLFAGHETTTSLLSNGLHAMLAFPDQIERLRQQPTLAADAVEEVLRFDGPNLSQARVAHESVQLHGKTIEPGDRVFLMLSAANRDPRVYQNPDRLHFERERIAHLAFGWGRHICLGFPLARLEGQIALASLVKHWQEVTATQSELQWHRSLVFRGVESMPLSVRWA